MTTVDPHSLENGSGFEVVDAPVMDTPGVPAKVAATTADAPPPAVPDLSDAADFAVVGDGEGEAAAASPDAAASAAPEPEPPVEPRSKGLYFVRIPRPNIDDGKVKALQATFQTHVKRVRDLNEKLQTKRGEMIELRKQMSLAKSLRDGSQPEFEEKLTRLQELRAMRSTRVGEIKNIRSGLKGLEVRSEQELEEKIRELESSIADGQLTIREEKIVVQNISKLKGQRSRVQQFDGSKSRLGELEGESSQVKAVISELEAEFNVLKGERDQAQKIIQDLYEKLKKAGEEYSVLEEEQKEVVDVKNEVLEKLNNARADMDLSMKDYRENRKFSLLIRDMVAAGQVDQAQLLCEQQVEEWTGKLAEDKAYRSEYFNLWSQQRKYVVSELLPNSAPKEVQAAQPGRGPPGQGAPRGAPFRPDGKQKAAAIIASALEEANKELASSAFRQSVDSVSEDDDDISDTEPVTVPVPATRKATGGDSVFKHKVELPPAALLQSDDFVLPVAVKSSAPVSSEDLKAKVREDNQKKAAEAAARKKRRQDAVDRKRQRAAETVKRRAEQASAHRAAGFATTSAAEETVTDLSTAENTAEDTDTGAEIVVAPVKSVPKQRVAHRTIKPVEKPVARIPRTAKKSKGGLKKWVNDNAVALAVASFSIIMVLLLLLWWSTMGR